MGGSGLVLSLWRAIASLHRSQVTSLAALVWRAVGAIVHAANVRPGAR
jgi:hypothetical protein